uniref:Uncharacterized protein n=1 Tax=Glossina austeni TaxID=7395 RepID=A0A1A9UPR5_GLOAU
MEEREYTYVKSSELPQDNVAVNQINRKTRAKTHWAGRLNYHKPENLEPHYLLLVLSTMGIETDKYCFSKHPSPMLILTEQLRVFQYPSFIPFQAELCPVMATYAKG